MSRRSVIIRQKVRQFQHWSAKRDASGGVRWQAQRPDPMAALANVMVYSSSRKRLAQESALSGPHPGNGFAHAR